MQLIEAVELVGGLSKPSKMPCQSYSIPAYRCQVGSQLAKVEKSVCFSCYAAKGFYRMPNVKNCLEKRYESLSHPNWVEAMTVAIRETEKSGFFRWHDSGDLQSLSHLEKICQIAINLPHIQFWLPTREYHYVSLYKKQKDFPSNLIIRLSAFMVNGQPPTLVAKRLGVLTSGVSNCDSSCPAGEQGNKCLDCRACWQKDVENVNYKLH